MKTFFSVIRTNISIFSLLGLAALASCSGEDEPAITPAAPTVTIAQGTGSSAYPGDTLILNAEVNANANLRQVDVFRDQANIASYPLTADFLQFTVPEEEYIVSGPDAGQNITFTFEARDENDKIGIASHTLEVFAETPMAYDSVGAILGNRIGEDPSAWNLVDNLRLGRDDAGADMQNPSFGTGTEEQQWIKGWDGENGTTFVKSNNYDYENATVESATAAFAEGMSKQEVRDVQVGDIYIANMRDGGNYAVLYITAVSEDVPDDNPEEIIFDYKKASETAGQ